MIRQAGFGLAGLTLLLDIECDNCEGRKLKLIDVQLNLVFLKCQNCREDIVLEIRPYDPVEFQYKPNGGGKNGLH
jgi:hypothetical protein